MQRPPRSARAAAASRRSAESSSQAAPVSAASRVARASPTAAAISATSRFRSAARAPTSKGMPRSRALRRATTARSIARSKRSAFSRMSLTEDTRGCEVAAHGRGQRRRHAGQSGGQRLSEEMALLIRAIALSSALVSMVGGDCQPSRLPRRVAQRRSWPR